VRAEYEGRTHPWRLFLFVELEIFALLFGNWNKRNVTFPLSARTFSPPGMEKKGVKEGID